MSKNYYMHTINGKPAYYERNKQIAFANGGSARNKIKFSQMFCSSLSMLRRQQRASIVWRQKRNMSYDGLDYGYVRVLV